MLVLISKVNADNRGISLVEVVWRVLEEVINTCINSVVQFHYVLHGFCAGSRTGTAIMELKLAQELVILDQDPLLLVFLDLRKAYGNLY